jgi:phosphatidylserine decarboxylase
MKLPIAREGHRLIVLAFAFAFVVPLIPGLGFLRWPLLFFAGFVVAFFRDPDRISPPGEDLILSPADGTIVRIEDVVEPTYFKGPVKMIAIFMSPLNCHINRFPMTGRVTYRHYNPGTFSMAWRDKASELNEQNSIGIEGPKIKLLVRQIAGFLARRIICKVDVDQVLAAGERFGLIQFGSRVDVFLPADVEIRVKLGDPVKGGLSILGVIL